MKMLSTARIAAGPAVGELLPGAAEAAADEEHRVVRDLGMRARKAASVGYGAR